jgi:hypothetical protein
MPGSKISRRHVLLGTALSGAAAVRSAEPPKIAAVVTEYRENSHADVIVTKFLEGCKTAEVDYQPRVKIASLYLDQRPPRDTGVETAKRHGVPIFDTIAGALTLGGPKLAVDGVLLIGEHGQYPYNELGQHLYPRRRFFEAAAEVMRRDGRSVPVFNDKHLAYAWADAHFMYRTARELKIPMLAGSSVPVARRVPDLRLDPGTDLLEALSVGYGGTESYGFHALEGLQCMVERRKGGETGVRSVQCVSGEAVWAAADAGAWSWDVLRAALSRSEKPAVATATREIIRAKTREPDAFLIEYRDGFRAAVLMLYGLADEFLFAGKVRGRAEPVSTLYRLQEGKPFDHFARLNMQIERMFLTGKPPYPVERTVLTTGMLDAALHSRFEKGARRATPELELSYAPPAGEP